MHPLYRPEVAQELLTLDVIAESIEENVKPSNANKMALRFFTDADNSLLDEDIEALEELRDISVRQGSDYDRPLERVLDILRNFQDTYESIQL